MDNSSIRAEESTQPESSQAESIQPDSTQPESSQYESTRAELGSPHTSRFVGVPSIGAFEIRTLTVYLPT